MPQGELREAVRWEAKKHASLPVEELVIDFLVIGETQEKELKRSEVMLVMAERAMVQRQMEEFHRSGIKISALDVNHLVLLNTLRHHRSGDLTENLVYVDIGAGKLDIGIVKRGILRFTRTVQTGGNDITQAIQQELQVGFGVAERMKRELGLLSKEGLPANRLRLPDGQVPDGQGQSGLVGGETAPRLHQVIKGGVDRFVVEVQRSVDYYRAQFHEGAVQRLLLMGGVVLMPGFLEYFSSYFDARVEIDDPFSGIRCGDRFSKDLKAMAPRFASGIGLALRKA
jgi:type IV pilus assembly protein PilM